MAGKSLLLSTRAAVSNLSAARHFAFAAFSCRQQQQDPQHENAGVRRSVRASSSSNWTTLEPGFSYEAQAAVGRVVCNSRGCSPIFDRPAPPTDVPEEFSEFLNEVWMEKGAAESYFSVGVEANPLDSKLLCEYALFSWKLQHDADKAEDQYTQALQVAPDDADIIASYALFLWQSDL